MKPVRPDAAKPASIYDVAKRAGVSIKTVSRVVNRQSNVSDATRERVMQAVEELSYRPNIFARGLASERSFLIGLLYDNPSAGYIAGLQVGVLSRCREEGYHLIVESLDAANPGIGRQVQSLVSESSLHGVILTPPLSDCAPVIEALKEADTPYVRIAPDRPMEGSADVRIDDFKAAYDMTAYLVGLGHRRIGFIKGHPEHLAAMSRFSGYKSALEQAGLPLLEELCVQGYFSYQSGLDAGEKLLSLPNPPTAIFAANDDMAAAVLACSQRFSLKIPQQLSVAGFDDSLVAQVVSPRLTTCRQPIREMAEAAVTMLIQRASQDGPLERHLDHELVVRESTVPPSNS